MRVLVAIAVDADDTPATHMPKTGKRGTKAAAVASHAEEEDIEFFDDEYEVFTKVEETEDIKQEKAPQEIKKEVQEDIKKEEAPQETAPKEAEPATMTPEDMAEM